MTQQLTKRGALALACHEGACLETYLDSAKPPVWTWGIGVTDASGHNVQRYKDKPATLERVIEIYLWLLNTRYVPAVLKAFDGHKLTEAQLAAATSFHYNTGAIGNASWVKLFKAGKLEEAEKSFLSWRIPEAIIPRRAAEADLLFDGIWPKDIGFVTVYPVGKPSYLPQIRKGVRTDIRGML